MVPASRHLTLLGQYSGSGWQSNAGQDAWTPWVTNSPAPRTAPGLSWEWVSGCCFQPHSRPALSCAWLVIHEHLPALLLPTALLPPPNYFRAYLIDVECRLRIFLFLLLTISSKRRKIDPVCLSYYSDA